MAIMRTNKIVIALFITVLSMTVLAYSFIPAANPAMLADAVLQGDALAVTTITVSPAAAPVPAVIALANVVLPVAPANVSASVPAVAVAENAPVIAKAEQVVVLPPVADVAAVSADGP